MTAPIFVDTNLLVYSLDPAAREKHHRAREWMALAWRTRRGRVSVQVLQEFYVTVTRKLRPGLSRDAARVEVRSFLPWNPIEVGPYLIERAWYLEDRFGLSWWDSLIVAAAQSGGCRHLLTEDLQDGQDLEGLTVLNPFAHAPESIPS